MPFSQLIKIILITLTVLLLSTNLKAAQDGSGLIIVTPQVRPPFDRVFAEIVNGIQEQVGGSAKQISIDDNTSSAQLSSMLSPPKNTSVIGLGNQAKNLLESFGRQQHVILGAVFLNPTEENNKLNGISLVPSPVATFAWLHKITPEIKRVHVVYQEDYSGWLVDLADKAAVQKGLQLEKYVVTDVRQAAAAFRQILETSDPATNAIWLMQRDPTLDEKAVVPDILEQAWKRNFIVFSNNPAHVPRGALFALYPDNHRMGKSLAKLALDTGFHGVIPLNDLLIAVNIRTASHVGKNFARSDEKQFDLIFPSR